MIPKLATTYLYDYHLNTWRPIFVVCHFFLQIVEMYLVDWIVNRWFEGKELETSGKPHMWFPLGYHSRKCTT